MLNSIVCRHADFTQPWYHDQELNLMIRRIYAGHSAAEFNFVNRKFWEWCAIVQALDERCMLRTGMRALGFAVGTEPLSSFFAGRGCTVLATDLHDDMSDANWIATHQHAASTEQLFQPLLVQREIFDARVVFQPADMRALDGLTSGSFDFLWSSCALEHLGTLQAGLDFIMASARLLRPGGIAVHTTEFNVRSDAETVEAGGNVIYRQRDILQLQRDLEAHGFRLAPPNFDAGSDPFDLQVDKPPYMAPGQPHVKLEIEGFVSTSMVLIIERPA